jgi:hypothetical protein
MTYSSLAFLILLCVCIKLYTGRNMAVITLTCLIIFAVLSTINCTTAPYRQYNVQYEEDQTCLNSDHGMRGYCDKGRHE